MTSPPRSDEQIPEGRLHKLGRSETWAVAVGVLILLGLLGHVLNQQQAPKRTPDDVAAPREPTPVPAETKTEAPQPSATARQNAPKPAQVVYMVTHKHRLRDCHGTLTFTRDGLRYESDEPQDSFAVGRDDVTIDGDALRIHNRSWRFEFENAVSSERIFRDWKTGTLRPISAP
jgi:hypothetical protein